MYLPYEKELVHPHHNVSGRGVEVIGGWGEPVEGFK